MKQKPSAVMQLKEKLTKTVLEDGTKMIGPYTNGSFTYIDKYKGFNWFTGREEVTKTVN